MNSNGLQRLIQINSPSSTPYGPLAETCMYDNIKRYLVHVMIGLTSAALACHCLNDPCKYANSILALL